MQKDISGPGEASAELALNRLLFDSKGTEFIFALADYILERGLIVSEEAVRYLAQKASEARR